LANSPAGIAAALEALASRPDSAPSLAAIRAPTLVVCGSEDVLTPLAESEALHRAIPENRLEVIPRAGHLSNLENPPAFNPALSLPTGLAFLPDGRLLVTEQGGTLLLVADGTATPLIRIAAEYCPSPESGLVGVAVDPAFATNGFIYLYRTKPGPRGCNSPEG